MRFSHREALIPPASGSVRAQTGSTSVFSPSSQFILPQRNGDKKREKNKVGKNERAMSGGENQWSGSGGHVRMRCDRTDLYDAGQPASCRSARLAVLGALYGCSSYWKRKKVFCCRWQSAKERKAREKDKARERNRIRKENKRESDCRVERVRESFVRVSQHVFAPRTCVASASKLRRDQFHISSFTRSLLYLDLSVPTSSLLFALPLIVKASCVQALVLWGILNPFYNQPFTSLHPLPQSRYHCARCSFRLNFLVVFLNRLRARS